MTSALGISNRHQGGIHQHADDDIRGTPLHHQSRTSFSVSASPSHLFKDVSSGSSSGAGLSRLFSIRRKQPPSAVGGEGLSGREEVETLSAQEKEGESPFITDASKGAVGISFPTGPSQPDKSGLGRSRSLLSRSVPLHSDVMTWRPRQQSMSTSKHPVYTHFPDQSLQDSTSVLRALDLNNSSPAIIPPSSTFSSFLRKGTRHARAKTLDRNAQSAHQPHAQGKAEGRSRKLSLNGFNFFKSHIHADKPPTTPEIEMWKEKKTDDSNIGLHYIRGDAGVKSSASHAVEEQHTTGLRLLSEQDGDGPPFVAGLNAISPTWTRVDSATSSASNKRKPMPPLDLSAIANAEATLDSPLPSFHENHRPYSLISTDTEGNDTPIVRLRRLIVDTQESEEDHDKQSRLFFRHIPAGDVYVSSSGSVSPERELILDRHSPKAPASQSDAGLLASGHSSGSSTLNARLISNQVQMALQQQGQRASQTVELARRNPLPSFHPDLEEENQFQYQQRQPPRQYTSKMEEPSSPVSGPTHSLLSARPSSEAKRESAVSSRTDSSVYEAVLGRATSTRLHSVPLRRLKVEEWAQQLALSEMGKAGAEELADRNVRGHSDGIPDIPDETASSEDVTSILRQDYPAQEVTRVEPHPRTVQNRLSSSNVSEAARLGQTPSKRSRTDYILTDAGIGKGKVEEDATSRQGRNASDESKQRIARREEESVKSEADRTNGTSESKESNHRTRRRRSKTSEERGTKDSHRHRSQSRILSSNQSYLTSEEAAVAKRKEQEEREARSKERRLKRELARQEAYAEKKRNDPLLKMRLALVGLSTIDDSAAVMTVKEEAADQLHPLKQSTDSANVVSKSSFYTAHEDEEQEQVVDDEEGQAAPYEASNEQIPRQQQQHRRNQASTASATTITSQRRGSETSTPGTSTSLSTFPQPPLRYGTPTKAEDGTVLARARLHSHDASAVLYAPETIESWSATPKAYSRQLPDEQDGSLMLVDGHRLRLSHGATVRDSPVTNRQPALINDQEECDRLHLARIRRSHVPEVFDRFSLQSFVN